MLRQGESLHYVKEQLGHASIQTTVDVYGHLVPKANHDAVNSLADAPGASPVQIAPAAGQERWEAKSGHDMLLGPGEWDSCYVLIYQESRR